MSANFRGTVIKALQHLNIEKVAPNSQIDHHTPGLNYLNLQRSDKFTLKLYLIAGLNNNNGGYLIHPHSHRYDFSTTVLAGRISNIVFNDIGPKKPVRDEQRLYEESIAGGGDLKADRYEYRYGEGLVSEPVKTWLEIDTGKSAGYGPGDSYYLKPDQIHTLMTWDEPTLLCLSQFADVAENSSLYLPHGATMPAPTGRTPTIEETEAMRVRCLELLQ